MTSFNDYLKEQLENSEFKKEFEALEAEFSDIQAKIDACKEVQHSDNTGYSCTKNRQIVQSAQSKQQNFITDRIEKGLANTGKVWYNEHSVLRFVAAHRTEYTKKHKRS